MKKLLLFVTALCFTSMSWAQQQPQLQSGLKQFSAPAPGKIGHELVKSPSLTQPATQAPMDNSGRDVNYVTIIDIGTSANAYGYGYGGGQKSLVWADDNINVVTNFHRMGGTLDPTGYSGDLGYDISFDGGMTWTNMVECYISNVSGGTYNIDAARYPNHGIYNPLGNTDPNAAYVTWFAPVLDYTNGDGWGGYTWGRASIGDVEDSTKHLQGSTPPFYQYIPDAFDISKNGHIVVVDANQDWTSGSIVYQGNLIVSHGVWNEDIMDFEYTMDLLDCPTGDDSRPAIVKFAFGPDGMTGWIVALANTGNITPISGLNYFYPILWKTEDGGESWSDPIEVQLDGPDGIPGVKNYLTDDQIAALFEPPLPSRDEIAYTTAFDCDLAVDYAGNPHIAVVVGLGGSDEYSIVTEAETFAAFDLFSMDGGTTWDGFKCGNLKLLRGNFPDDTYTEDNRIQIASTMDGHYMFVGWLDTWLEGATENNAPDIFCRGIKVDYANGFLFSADENGEDLPNNVTYFSEGMWQSYFFGMSRYALVDDNNNFIIPLTYEDMDATLDPGLPVQFKYIQDFMYTEADFIFLSTDEPEQTSITSVSQNYPNPFNNTSNVFVNIERSTTLKMVVTNMLGQQLQVQDLGKVSAGSHQFTIDASSMNNGIYFYTIYAGKESVSKKMIVQ